MPKLPVLRLTQHAVVDLLANLALLARLAALWLLPAAAMALIANAGLLLLGDLVATVGVTAVAVAWHRRLLLGETPPRWTARLQLRVARYLLMTVVTVLLAVAPVAIVIQLATGNLTASPSTVGATAVAVAAVAGFYVSMRVQLVFPAIAVDDPGARLAASWAGSDGNGWRLATGFLLLTVPVTGIGILATEAVRYVAEISGSLILRVLAAGMPLAAAFAQAALLAAFLSFARLFLQAASARPGAATP